MIQIENFNIQNNYTKEKIIAYELFIESSMLLLGFSYSSNGTILFKKMLKIVHTQNYESIKIEEVFKQLSNEYNISIKTIKSNINSTFRRINKVVAKQNFKNIFGIDYNEFFFTPKNLIILFLNTLNKYYS